MNPPSASETIFHAARAFAPGERSAYLQGACGGDAELHASVVALLQADSSAGDFLAERAEDGAERAQPDTQPAAGEQPGDRIDNYKLLQQIGEGGFGTVWMADQLAPVRRKVALKIIKLGMDTRHVVARFEVERQALAMMDHPNIARVLDAGATQTGRPYFVMELVKGSPIVDYADKNNLTIPERLDLFAQVCHAVQHAHSKGIIHRDLKPSNVLVGTQDGRPLAKVIDFGIAKATSQNLTDKTLFTEHEQVIGTLMYMSPEQAEGSLDIDTRTDVYSLGVVLYELLVGEPPFSRVELQNAGMMEVQRILREVEPKKPSTRINASRETLAMLAARRHTEPKRLGKVVRGDLDWIVMKALEKDRARRYETVNGLVMDIQRHVAGEAVNAAPPSAGYRLRKFVRRNKATVTAGTVVAIVLVAGIIGTSYGMVWALDEKERADDLVVTEAAAKVAAQENEEKAIAAAARAEAATVEEAAARHRAETINEFVTTALKSSDPENTGGMQEMTILAAMNNAIADLDSGRFQDEPETEAGLKNTIATILQNNGRVAEAEPLFKQALELSKRLFQDDHPDVAMALSNLADVRRELGRATEAELLNVQALEMRQRLYPDGHEDVARSLSNLAQARAWLGRAAEAEPLFEEALRMFQRIYQGDHPKVARALNNLGLVRERLGRVAAAETLFVQARDMLTRVFQGDHQDVAIGLGNVARARMQLGRAAEAEPLFVQALEMNQRLFRSDHPAVAAALSNLAGLRASVGRAAEAEPLLEQSQEMLQRLYPGDHPVVASNLSILARIRHILDKTAEAREGFDAAIAMERRLSPAGSISLARAVWRSASARLDNGAAAAALPELEEAVAWATKRLPAEHPHLAEYRETLAKCRAALGK